MNTVKIFGERNTSTNALKLMILKNSESCLAPSVSTDLDPGVRTRLNVAKKLLLPHWFCEKMIDRVFVSSNPLEAWKHCATNFGDIQVFTGHHVVFCVRHPASWLLGLHRKPYHIPSPIPADFRDFLRLRWKTLGRERLERTTTTATELYNIKMAAFNDIQSRFAEAGIHYSVVRHEDFAVHQERVFARLAPHLFRPTTEFTAVENSTKDPRKNREFYRGYYGNRLWNDEIDAECMRRIRDEIDWAALDTLDYSP